MFSVFNVIETLPNYFPHEYCRTILAVKWHFTLT